MKKRYNLRDLDCANCAANIENAIRRIDGVRDASVSFLTQKLTLEADEGRFDAILREAVAVCRKIEPDCVIEV